MLCAELLERCRRQAPRYRADETASELRKLSPSDQTHAKNMRCTGDRSATPIDVGLGVIGHSHKADQLGLARTTGKAFFERRDGTLEIISALCQRPGYDRIGTVGGLKDTRPFLFGSDVAIEDLNDPIKIAD
jgi:hypothetical protein